MLQEIEPILCETEIICPYCKKKIEADIHESCFFDCPFCHKKFDIKVEYNPTYSMWPVDKV